jgi:hypothetical protein
VGEAIAIIGLIALIGAIGAGGVAFLVMGRLAGAAAVPQHRGPACVVGLFFVFLGCFLAGFMGARGKKSLFLKKKSRIFCQFKNYA